MTLAPLLAQADTVVVDADPGLFAGLDLWVRAVVAVVVVVVAVVVGIVLQRLSEPRLARLRTRSFGSVFSRLLQFAVVLAGVLTALVVVFPSVDVATLVGGLGVLGIAAGFAFQDILSNLLAGILLIFRQPFVSGDQITVNGISGTVDEITIRETRIRTFDGRLVVVPNQDVYTSAIEVQTHQERVRTSLEVGVGYDTDLGAARSLALEVLDGLEDVLDEPAPQAYCTELGDSAVTIDLRYWTSSQQADIRRAQDAVVAAIYDAYDDAGIDLPFPTVTLDAATSAVRVAGPGDG